LKAVWVGLKDCLGLVLSNQHCPIVESNTSQQNAFVAEEKPIGQCNIPIMIGKGKKI